MKKFYILFNLFLLIILLSGLNCEINKHFCYHLVNEAKDELELENSIKKYFSQMKDDSPYCIEYLLKTSYYSALEVYVTKLNDAGIKFRETLSNSIKEYFSLIAFKEVNFNPLIKIQISFPACLTIF